MANTLNLYSTKVFSEHPIALWAMDEDVKYISLIPSENQNLNAWEFDDATVVDATDSDVFIEPPPRPVFKDIPINGIIENEDNPGVVTFTSNFEITEDDINRSLNSFSFGLYALSYDRELSVRIGYEYTISALSDEEEEPIEETIFKSFDLPKSPKVFSIPPSRKWAFVSEEFRLPEFFSSIKFVIEFSYEETDWEDLSPRPYEFAINGITIGQGSENFQTTSLGSFQTNLPENLDIPGKGVKTYSYGTSSTDEEYTGYYLINENKLCAKNSTMPLVFGTDSGTQIVPNKILAQNLNQEDTHLPSIIFPGFGFLNDSGKNNNMTAEFWASIQSDSYLPRRIFGPVFSEDGIYVEGPFLKVKVGINIGSHYVGEWDRPMLIDFRFSYNAATLILNGEEVISLNLPRETFSLPSKFENGNSLDWLGFYAYDDVPQITIDSFAIYPYDVPAIIAKRRFVYGQAVTYPDNLSGINSRDSVLIDHSVAGYDKHYSFPKSSGWSSGINQNVVVDNYSIAPSDYSVPKIVFSNISNEKWERDLNTSQYQEPDNPAIMLKPNLNWQYTDAYMIFRRFNLLDRPTKAFYGVFEFFNEPLGRQTLFEIRDELRNRRFVISTNNDSVEYSLFAQNFAGLVEEKVLHSYELDSTDEPFAVGIDIDKFSKFFGQEVSSFFGSGANLKFYVGGNNNFENTFGGKIYRIGLADSFNLVKIDNWFAENGTVETYDPEHTASYTLIAKNNLGAIAPDILTDSYWEDYVPLSYFSKNLQVFRKKKQELDFLQLNLDYPKNNKLNYVSITNGTPTIFEKYNHKLSFGDRIVFRSFGELPGGISEETLFFVKEVLDQNKFTISRSFDGAEVSTVGQQSGLHEVSLVDSYILITRNESGQAVINKNNHGLVSPDRVSFVTNGELPVGISSSENYYVFKVLNNNSFILGKYVTVSTPSGAPLEKLFPVEIEDAQIGQHFMSSPNYVDSLIYDTRNETVKLYASFQYLKSGANERETFFNNIEPLKNGRVVRPGSNWYKTKYEVTDDTVIYPPRGVSINNLALVIHMQISSGGIISNPIKIKSLQLSSKALSTSPNEIGTKFGPKIIPYIQSGLSVDYKSFNPFSTYRGSSPYLYNTANSGIRLKKQDSPGVENVLSIPINSNLNNYYKVSSFQFSLRYDEPVFPTTPVQIFQIKSTDQDVRFYLVADFNNPTRGFVFAINSTEPVGSPERGTSLRKFLFYLEKGLSVEETDYGKIKKNVMYYVNGNPVKRPTLTPRLWFTIGISFAEPLNFGLDELSGRISGGSFRMTGALSFNNFAFYQISRSEEESRVVFRKWSAVRANSLGEELEWDFWANTISEAGELFKWRDVLFVDEESPVLIDPEKIYKQFAGTNRDFVYSDYPLRIYDGRYVAYNNLSWRRQVLDSA